MVLSSFPYALSLTGFLFSFLAFLFALFLLLIPFFLQEENYPPLAKSASFLSPLIHFFLLLAAIFYLCTIQELNTLLKNDTYIWAGALCYTVSWTSLFVDAGFLVAKGVELYLKKARKKAFSSFFNKEREGEPYDVYDENMPIKKEPFDDVPDNPLEGEDLSSRLEGPGVEVIDVSSTPIDEEKENKS